MIVVSSLSDDFCELLFEIPDQGFQVAVAGSFNLIEEAFCKLQSLYFKPSVSLSTQYCVGDLIGSSETPTNCVGNVLPLSILDTVVENMMKARILLAFLEVCRCVIPGVTIRTTSHTTEEGSTVNLPAHSIWVLMAFAEVLGAQQVYEECRSRLERMVLATPTKRSLPQSLASKLNPGDVSAVEEKLVSHLRQFGSLQELPAAAQPVLDHPSPPAVREQQSTTTGSSAGSYNLLYSSVQESYLEAVNDISHTGHPQAMMQSQFQDQHVRPVGAGAGAGSVYSRSSGSRSVQTDVGYESDTVDTVGDDELGNWPSRSQYRTPLKRETSGAGGIADTSTGLNSSTATRSVSPAPFGSGTPRFHQPFATTSATPRPATTPTPRFPRSRRVVDPLLGASPGTDAEEEYDSDGPTRHALSREDLRISREIAKLRLREVKMKEEIEASKLQAEREAREARLKSLGLKAQIARTTGTKSPLRRDTVTAENTRRNASLLAVGSPATVSRSNTPTRGATAHGGPGRTPMRGSSSGAAPGYHVIAEEARTRAAQRVREAKLRAERMEAAQRALEQDKEAKKWAARDRKIEEFKRRQLASGVMHPDAPQDGISAHWLQGKSDSPVPLQVTKSAGGLRVATNHRQVPAPTKDLLRSFRALGGGVSDGGEEDEESDGELGNRIVEDGCYSAEALRAVGLGRSPASKMSQQRRPPPPPPSASGTYGALPPAAPEAITELVTVKVLRAWGLPEELGGTNAYVVLDWGRCGRAATQAVADTTDPHFGSTLQFKSPYSSGSSRLRSATVGPEDAGLMRVFVMNRNQSVSDELIAVGEIDPLAHVEREKGEPAVLELRCARDKQPAGCLEYIVSFWPISF